MYIRQGDLFQATSVEFLRLTMAMASRESHAEGTALFHNGEPADFLYVLINGRVELRMGEPGTQVYITDRTGESFGWARLVGRSEYPASARCLLQTDLLVIAVDAFQRLLDRYIEDGFVFYKNLSMALGARLLSSYQKLSDHSGAP